MTERIISDEYLKSIRKAFYEAGKKGRNLVLYRRFDGPEIVRCRDCKMSLNNGEACWYFAHEEWGETVPAIVRPDGYCSWGERGDE